MKKYPVKIITLFENNNYGNRLQNFATVKIFEEYGIQALTVRLSRRYGFFGHMRDLIARIRDDFKQIMRGEAKRIVKFNRFSKKNTPSVSLVKKMSKDMKNSVFVVGSDQVWNPFWGIGARKDGMQCAFGIPANKKIALSPSFGVSFLNKEDRVRYKTWLQDYTRLSIRENEGFRILENLVDCPIEVLIDPTMVLSAQQWRQHKKSPCNIDERYVFIYRLGELNASVKDQVDCFSTANNYNLVDLMDQKNAFHLSDPFEWIGLLDESDYVLTDSFHGCVFALLFHVPFAVFRREEAGQVEMSSRINTLLKKFHCENRMILDNNDLPTQVIDWRAVDDILEKERSIFLDYLEKELSRTGLLGNKSI